MADGIDVLVVGAGPAGSVAATLLARAGARVCLVDRAAFPRPKLCGDSLNPGARSALARLGFTLPEHEAVPVAGMLVSGHPHPVTQPGDRRGSATVIAGRYPSGVRGLMVSRQRLDAVLLAHAVDAGVRFESQTAVLAPAFVDTVAGRRVAGAVVATPGGRREIRAGVTIAADGRMSRLANALGLLAPARQPRRWAIGGYVESAAGQPAVDGGSLGEMHIRSDGYLGVAPLAGGLTNLCVVSSQVSRRLQDPADFLLGAFARDPLLGERMRAARLVSPVTVLGPLAVEPTGRDCPGLLVAGDAAGFIDPMTGDGMCLAIRGGELAAQAAIQVLAHGWDGVHACLRAERQRAFAAKWRFNRALRSLVSSPRLVQAAAIGGRLAPSAIGALITYAGDVRLACADETRPVEPTTVVPRVAHLDN